MYSLSSIQCSTLSIFVESGCVLQNLTYFFILHAKILWNVKARGINR